MNRGVLSVIGSLLLLALGAWYLSTYVSEKPLTSEEDLAVRAMVSEFGTQLRFVSLLASTDDRRAAMEEHYSKYVSGPLLATWAPEGAEALGRYTSSPSPERIEIMEVRKPSPETYVVEGTVIETAITASSSPEVVATYPVTLTIKKQGERYLIVGVTKGAYSEIPHRQTLTGKWECLPHKDTTGPQTAECTFGIAIDASDAHYAVDTAAMSTYPVDFATGTHVKVSGVVVPANQLNTDQWQKYNMDGIIHATEIEKL